MGYNTIKYVDQTISVKNLGELIHEFIDVLSTTGEITGLEQKQQNELKNIFDYLKGKGSISHDLISTFGSLVSFDIAILKDVVSGGGGEVVKEGLENSIKVLELSYNKERTIGVLIEHLKVYVDNNFLTHLLYNNNLKNYISINNEEFFLLAIADNLYKNAEKFITDKSSIQIFIKEDGNFIIIKSSNLSSQEFEENNRESILTGQGNIISQEGNDNMRGQGIYLMDLAQQLKKVGGKIDIIDSPFDSGQYHVYITITIPKV